MLAVPTLSRPERITQAYGNLPVSRGPMPPLNYQTGATHKQLSVKQELSSFHGYNFIAVNLIARCGATIFPEIGHVRGVKPGQERQYLSHQKRRMLQSAGIYVDSDENWEVVKSHPLLDLLRKPYPGGSWTTFAYQVHMYWQLCGECWVWKIPGQGINRPVALWPVPNDTIRPVLSADQTTLLHYEVQSNSARPFQVPPEQMMRGLFPSPITPGAAFSATQAIAPWLMSAEAIDTSQYMSFSTDVHSDIAVLLDKDAYPSPDKATLDTLKQLFMSRASGLRNKGPIMVPGATKLEKLRTAPKEMDYSESGHNVRDNTMAARSMNKFSAGISSDMNRGDTQEAQVALWTNAIDPNNVFFGDMLTTQLAPDFEDDGLILAFPSGRPVDVEQDRLDDQFDWLCGALTPNERRKKRSRDPLPMKEADMVYISGSMQPLEGAMDPEELLPVGDDNRLPEDSVDKEEEPTRKPIEKEYDRETK